MITYTESEKQKKYTVQDAINAAKVRLGGQPICVNALSGKPADMKISLQELNNLADAMCADTYFYNN